MIREPRLSAPQSTAASAAGIHATFFVVVDSLDKQMAERERAIHLASAGWGGYFSVTCVEVETWEGGGFDLKVQLAPLLGNISYAL